MRKLAVILMAAMLSTGTYAQDWKSKLGGLLEKAGEVVEQVKEGPSIIGTWQFVKPDCKFEGEDFVAKAGGEVAAKKLEEEIAQHLSKLGFNEGTVYTFNEDSTFTSTIGKRTTKGTYSYNKETNEIMMKSRIGLKSEAVASFPALGDGKKMSLLFNADKLMSLAQSISGALAGKSKTSSALNSVLEKYEGLKLGFEMEKK